MAAMSDGDRAFLRKLLILGAVVVAALALWTLRQVVLLLFAAILTALFLQALCAPLRRLGLDRRLALGLVILVLAVVFGLGAFFFGLGISQQVAEAFRLVPQAFEELVQELRTTAFGSKIVNGASEFDLRSALPALLHLPGYALSTLGAFTSVLIVGFGALFISVDPDGYTRSIVALAPPAWRSRLHPFLNDAGGQLRRWLIAQALGMVTVGVLTWLGLMMIGIPAAGALGLFAAAAEFVPIVGPIVASIPALLLASLHGWDKVGWTLLLFIVVQQFESNLMLPVLQQKIVSLRPVVVLFSLMVFDVLFGFVGLLLALPLTIVLKAALDTFYFGAGDGHAGAQTSK
jgi:predicted PurR-regulated permease PerM